MRKGIKKIVGYVDKIKNLILFSCIFVLTSCNDVTKVENIKQYLDEQLQMNWQDTSRTGFWGARLFRDFFDMLNNVYVDKFDFLTKISLTLLAVGFGIWLAVYSMRYVGALNNPNPTDYLNNVFKRGFIVMCIAAFLANGAAAQKLLDYTAILAMDFFASSSVMIANDSMEKYSGGTLESRVNCPDISLSRRLSIVDENHLVGLRDSFTCVIVEMHKQLSFGIAFGKLIKDLAEEFPERIVGFFLFIFFTLIDFVLPLFLMDGLFKFMIAMILSPLFIAAWAFPSTRGYTKKAWAMVIGMGFQILFTVVFVSFAVVCVRRFGLNDDEDIMRRFMSPATYTNHSATADFAEETRRIFNGEMKALSLMFAGLFLLILTDKISGMAKDFSDAPATSIVSGTVKKFGAGLISLAIAGLAVARTGGLALKDKAKEVTKKAGDAVMGTITEGMQ